MAVEKPIRKRVTRVGSGAFSIYLPKKWIDGWPAEQQEDREVELRFISESILISPVIRRVRFGSDAPPQTDAVRVRLLSAYVRGHNEVRITPREGRFDNDCVAAARDLMRHLDERLVAVSTPEEIGFRLRSDIPSPQAGAEDLLDILGAKVAEVMSLAADAVEVYGHDPDRALHSLRLLQDTHEEDVSRLFYQTVRLVATLEIPLESVTGYQLLGLTAAELHRMSEAGLTIAAAILRDYDLRLEDLQYPRPHLLEKMQRPPPQQGVARDIVRMCRDAFQRLRDVLQELLRCLREADIAGLRKVVRDAATAEEALQEGVFEAVSEHWGAETGVEAAMAGFTASKHTNALGAAFAHIASSARHGLVLLAAQPGEADAA